LLGLAATADDDPAVRREHQGPGAILRGMAIDLRMRWSADGDDRVGAEVPD
jgi:hypothetical protein